MTYNELPENGTALESVPQINAMPLPCNETEINVPPVYKAVKQDGIFAVIFWVLGYLYIRYFGFLATEGIFGLIFTVLYTGSVIAYLKYKNITMPRESLFWLALLFGCALSRALFENEGILVLSVMFHHCAAIYWTMSASNALIKKKTSSYLLLDALKGVFILPFASFGAWFSGIAWFPKKAFSNVKGKQMKNVLLGSLLGAVALCIILPQLINADRAFEGLFANLSNFLPKVSFLPNLLLAALVAAFLYSLLYSSAHQRFANAKAEQNLAKTKQLSEITICTVFGILTAVYVLFSAVVITQLIPALSGFIPQGTTYSSYAREGFFELCRVCSITIAVMSAAFAFAKPDWRKSTALKAVTAALCVSSVGLCVTALARMLLYIDVYGLTLLRFVTSAFILFLILVFVLTGICIYKPFNVVKGAFCTFCAGFVLLLLINVNGIIAGYNISSVVNNSLQNAEFSSLYHYSADELPAIEKIYKTLDDNSEYKEKIEDIIDTIVHRSNIMLNYHSFNATLLELLASNKS